jgi:hypothetical protein
MEKPMSENAMSAEQFREEFGSGDPDKREAAAREMLETRKRYIERETANADSFRKERYDLTAGRERRYIGVTRGIGGEVEFELAEYTLVTDSITLSRDEALHLIAGLQEFTK